MGVRGEIFSTRLILPNRTYFLNVKENRLGDLYLNIVESKNKETGGFERQSVIVFADDLPSFLGEFEKALKVLEKSVREQKRSGGKRREEPQYADGRSGEEPRFHRASAEYSNTGYERSHSSAAAGKSAKPAGKYGERGRSDGGYDRGGGRKRSDGEHGKSGKKHMVVKRRNRD